MPDVQAVMWSLELDVCICRSHAVEIGESDFSTAAGMEHVPETSLELGRDEEHDHHGSIQLGQSTESDVESGLQEVVVVRRRRSGLDHGHAGMGMGEVEEGGGGEGGGGGGGDDIDQSHRDSVLDVSLHMYTCGMFLPPTLTSPTPSLFPSPPLPIISHSLPTTISFLSPPPLPSLPSLPPSLPQSIQRRSMLHHLTTDRPKPPPQRRPPSRDRTPSPSPAHTSHGTTGPPHQHTPHTSPQVPLTSTHLTHHHRSPSPAHTSHITTGPPHQHTPHTSPQVSLTSTHLTHHHRSPYYSPDNYIRVLFFNLLPCTQFFILF